MDITERRRAADALRAIKRGGEGWYSLSDAVLGGPAPRDEVVARLADLIDPGEDVSVSAYDLLSEEDREALWWVHSIDGGLDAASGRYREADYRRIELCSALCIDSDTGWSDAMAEMLRRLMPEGYEWPRYENGQPVRPLDKFADCFGVTHTADAIVLMSASYILQESDSRTGELWSIAERAYGSPVKRPILAADGEPLEAGQTVWDEDGVEYVVCEVGQQSVTVEYWNEGIAAHGSIAPSQLTHTKPEPPDTWERIEEDARGLDSGVDREIFTHTHEDIVRRCKALAERGE